MTVILETDRIILRRFKMNDFKAVFAFGSNEEVQKYTGDKNLVSYVEAKELIRDVWLEDYKKYGYGRWATIMKSDNTLIGFAGLKYLPEFGETDIGFRFLPEYWGKGIATEVSNAIIQYGFEQLKLNRIIGIAMPDNIASNKVLMKIGLQFYKVDEYDGDGGNYYWYKLEREDFNSELSS